MNMIKTTLLLTALSLLLVAAGGLLGGAQGMSIALVMALGLNLGTYWFSDRLVLRMYRAREATPADAPELYGLVRELATRAGLPMPRVFIIDQQQPNAFATGRNPEHAVVAVTTGITQLLSPEELRGVLAHELAHIKHRDILVGTIAAAIAAAVSYLASMAQWALLLGGAQDDDDGGNPLIMIVMMIVAPLAAMIIQLAVSRTREYGADSGGARIAGSPRYLADALQKLDTASRQITMDASPATAHMFIVNPLHGGGFTRLFSTHPPIAKRIARLRQMGA